MPTKEGGGGHIQENYDPKTGRYTSKVSVENELSKFEQEKKASKLLGVDIVETNNISDVIPPITSKGEKRFFLRDLSNKEINELLANTYKEQLENAYEIEKAISEDPYTSLEIESVERQKARQKWVKNEIVKQNNEKQIKNEKKFYLVLGLPASGKSTIQDNLIKNNGAYEIDADIFKNYIPEYLNDNDKVSYIHDESVMLANKMLEEVSNVGGNIVLSKVGGYGSTKGLLEIIKNIKDKGYKINISLNDLPVDIAMERNYNRYVNGGNKKRLITPRIYFFADGYIFDTFDNLKSSGLVDGYSVYSNDVSKGQKPNLLYKNEKWEGEF